MEQINHDRFHPKSKADITKPNFNEFITTSEAAQMLGFPKVSVRIMVYRKKPASIRFGQSLLIPKNQWKNTSINYFSLCTAGLGRVFCTHIGPR